MKILDQLNKSAINQNIGERLRSSRLRTGMKAKEAAAILGISGAALSQFENGLVSPTVYNLLKLCILYNVSPGYIMLMDSDPTVGKKNIEHIANL